ncbi:MAG: PAS domain-containing protein [Fimbriimonadaceae bacterium]|nr:PAS domain-containing protein [Fimbriimonadaceae bacterium]
MTSGDGAAGSGQRSALTVGVVVADAVERDLVTAALRGLATPWAGDLPAALAASLAGLVVDGERLVDWPAANVPPQPLAVIAADPPAWPPPTWPGGWPAPLLLPRPLHPVTTRQTLALALGQAASQPDALREQREWLRVTLESIGDAVLAADLQRRVTFLNPVAAELTGWSFEDALGQPIQEVFRAVSERTGEPAEDLVERVLAAGHVVGLANHTALLRRDGSRVPIEDSAAPIRDAAGRVSGVVLVFHDVTTQRRAELRRQQLLDGLRAVLLAADDLLAAGSLDDLHRAIVEVPRQRLGLDRTGLFLLQGEPPVMQGTFGTNTSGETTDEREFAMPLDAQWRAFLVPQLDPADRWQIRRQIPLSDRGQVVAHGDHCKTLLQVGDQILGVLVNDNALTGQPIDATRQEVVGLYGALAAAILQRKRVVAALRQWADAFEHCAHGIAMGVPGQETVLACNPAFARLRGGTVADCLKQPILTMYHPDTRAHVGQQIPVADRDGQVAYEAELLQLDGTPVPVQVEVVAVKDQRGEVRYRVATFLDLRERRAAAAALAAAQEQLQQAVKMEAVGRLAGGVAHDFNNLLTAILGYADFMRQDPELPPRFLADLQEVRHAAQQAASLTQQLLVFSRKQVVQPGGADLVEVIRRLASMLRRVLGEDIELLVELPADPAWVGCDSGQVQQVLMNLAVNARDALPTGGKIRLAVALVDAAEAPPDPLRAPLTGNAVRLTVSDSGCGMDQATARRIFEPFFTTKALGQGTGLGLATVFGIVQQAGGRIAVESAPGAGTTFRLWFPQTAPPADSQPPAESALRGAELVLLVEDEPQLRRLAARALEYHGYAVLTAAGADEARLLFERHREQVALVLTDVVMPGGSGSELAAALREQRPDLPVLFMSGYTDDRLVHHGVAAAEAGFIQKPFTPSELASKVRTVLDQSAAG